MVSSGTGLQHQLLVLSRKKSLLLLIATVIICYSNFRSIFSQAGKILTLLQNRLLPYNFDVLLCKKKKKNF